MPDRMTPSLPSLPEPPAPRYLTHLALPAFSPEQVDDYGLACYRAGLEAAAQPIRKALHVLTPSDGMPNPYAAQCKVLDGVLARITELLEQAK